MRASIMASVSAETSIWSRMTSSRNAPTHSFTLLSFFFVLTEAALTNDPVKQTGFERQFRFGLARRLLLWFRGHQLALLFGFFFGGLRAFRGAGPATGDSVFSIASCSSASSLSFP